MLFPSRGGIREAVVEKNRSLVSLDKQALALQWREQNSITIFYIEINPAYRNRTAS